MFKQKSKYLHFISLVFIFLSISCRFTYQDTEVMVRFGICADVHREILHDVDVRLRTFVDIMNEKEVDFIIQLGDFCQPQYFNKPFVDIWDDFQGPGYHVLGNHDMDNDMGERFSIDHAVDYFGMPGNYYSYIQSGVHFIVLDDNETENDSGYGTPQYIGNKQLIWLENELWANNLPAVIFSHKSILRSIKNGNLIRDIIEKRNMSSTQKKVIACFNGHHHIDDAIAINDVYYVDINSMSYHFCGRDHMFSGRYGDRMDVRFHKIKETAPYKDAVFATVTIKKDGTINIEGVESQWVGPSPREVGRFRGYHWYDELTSQSNVFPGIKDKKLEPMNIWEPFRNMKEERLTSGKKGHFLYHTQIFSPDDSSIVYDTRNDETKIGETCCIELLHVNTGETNMLYRAPGQTVHGPGVGAAAFSPVDDVAIFIHGLLNCDETRPYGFTRRTGVAIAADSPGEAIFMDARDVIPPFTPGALRGGTHAHSWSGDGEWISFTYNDAIMERLEQSGETTIRDLRSVGVMAPYGPVKVKNSGSGEQTDGKMFSVIISSVTENPIPGSDQISRAYEEGWVGRSGYINSEGALQRRALAFLGDTRDENGNLLTEVFIADIPDDVTNSAPGQSLEGTISTRPAPPVGVVQRRLTYTFNRKYSGVQGPRHWLQSAPDGSMIYFLMKDDAGLIQIYGISPNGGEIRQFTNNDFSVGTTFSVRPDGQYIVYGSDETVYVTHLESGQTISLAGPPASIKAGLRTISWSNNGKMIAYNRLIEAGDKKYYHIFLLR